MPNRVELAVIAVDMALGPEKRIDTTYIVADVNIDHVNYYYLYGVACFRLHLRPRLGMITDEFDCKLGSNCRATAAVLVNATPNIGQVNDAAGVGEGLL